MAAAETRTIGIVGAGHVGGALGVGWAKAGHKVIFGVRDPQAQEIQDLLRKAGPNSTAAGPPAAAQGSEVIVLSVPWPATQQAIQALGDLRGKILLDCTNPVTSWPDMDRYEGVSGGEKVAAWARNARVVKIFNTTGFANMANPRFGSEALTMFYAGDDAEAKRVAHGLAADLGFEPQDAGPLKNAYHLEVLASLWGTLAMGQKLGTGIGFRLLKR